MRALPSVRITDRPRRRRTPRDRVQPDRPGRPAQERAALVPGHPLHRRPEFDEEGYRKHLAWLAEYPVAGLFAAGGTGEGFSLTSEETDRVVRAAVEEVARHRPGARPRDRQHRQRGRAGQGRRGGRRRRAAADAALPHRGRARPGWSSTSAGSARPPTSASSSTAAPTPSSRRRRRGPRRPQPDPDRVQGRRRRHRADDPHLRPRRRPADLRRRPADGGDLRPAAAPARRQHLLLRAVQLRARSGPSSSTTPCAPRTATRSTVGSTSSSSPTSTSATARQGYAVSIVKGGLTADRPPRRPGPPAADRPARRRRSPSSAT